jgi:hypothetical protein
METVRGIFGEPDVRIVCLERRSKKRSAGVAAASSRVGTTNVFGGSAICRVQDFGSSWSSTYGASPVGIAAA